MKSFTDRFFGVSSDVVICNQLVEMAETVQLAAHLLQTTSCREVSGITEYERKCDDFENSIADHTDTAFMLRLFEKRDVKQLASRLDDVVDGMRRTVNHMEEFDEEFANVELPSDALRLLTIIVEMSDTLVTLVKMLQSMHPDLTEVKRLVKGLDAQESEADIIFAEAKKRITKKYRPKNEAFLRDAWREFYGDLESVTDKAANCGEQIESIVRKG